jgi:hypothetical protein
MKNKSGTVHLPLTHALAWIVASTFVISGGSYAVFKHYIKRRAHYALDPQYSIRSIVQTGPQKEALKTEYLAELLEIATDKPTSSLLFNLEHAKKRLLKSPLISQAEIKQISPNTLYVDYTVRQPIAWLEDYENIVIDKEAYLFPFSPFFSPKNLPAIYIGLAPFGTPSSDPDRPEAQWNVPLKGKYIDLALNLLNLMTDPKVADFFFVKRIDVSNAFAESYGTREIVVLTEDTLIRRINEKQIHICIPRLLRLSAKNYAQELGNYLKLREQLLEEEKKTIVIPDGSHDFVRLKEKTIDFRLQKLAFIEEQKTK